LSSFTLYLTTLSVSKLCSVSDRMTNEYGAAGRITMRIYMGNQVPEINLPKCHFLHQKYHMSWFDIEPWPALGSFNLLQWRKTQHVTVDCRETSTKLYGITSQKTICDEEMFASLTLLNTKGIQGREKNISKRKRKKIIAICRRLYNKEFHNLYSLPNIISVIK
jgi:hypothetical protein